MNYFYCANFKKNKKDDGKFKISVIQQSPDIGGAETYMISLVSEFLKRKNEVYFATNKGKFLEMIKHLHLNLYQIPIILDISGNYRGLIKTIILLPVAIAFYLGLLLEFKRKSVNVILMSNFSEKLLVSFLSIFFKIPVVWIEYGPLKPIFEKNFCIPKVIYRLLKNIPQKVIVPSKNTLSSLINDAHVSLTKISLVPCGINIPKAQRVEKKEIKNKFVIGDVSRLAKEKGQEYLIKAMQSVLKKISNAELIIVGDGPDRESYQNLVRELNLDENIKFFGFVKDPHEFYSKMDIFVFPTVWELEGFGLVAIEAMSHGLPVIGSNVGPVPDIINDQKNGILVPPKDPKSIASAIITLAKDRKKRELMGKNAFKKVEKNYNLRKTSRKILDLLYEATF